MDNHDIALYFEMSDEEFFNGWLNFMAETYQTTVNSDVNEDE